MSASGWLDTGVFANPFVVPPQYVGDKLAIFRAMVKLMLKGRGYSADQVALAVQSLWGRERQQSTGVGCGVAVPHGKVECIREMYIGWFVSPNGIEWDSLDGEPVHLLFCILVPAGRPGAHLMPLGEFLRVARIGSDESTAFWMKAVQCESKETFSRLLRSIEGDD